MIYGIKQIEKQFPGFEARWCGAQLFDVREPSSTQQNLYKTLVDTIGEKRADEYSEDENRLYAKHRDIIKPPNNKCYFVVGNSLDKSEWLEMAVEFDIDREDDDLFIKQVIIFIWWKKPKYNDPIEMQGRKLGVPDNIVYRIYGKPDPIRISIKDDGRFVISETMVSWIKKYEEASFMQAAKQAFLQHLVILIHSLFLINVKNTTKSKAYISQQRDFYYPKTWGREYKVLCLAKPHTREKDVNSGPPKYHVRGHFQRGHTKQKKHGVYYWRPHWRGDFSKGIVMKDYKVKASAGPTA
jgi:hypothetical protein